MCWEYTESCYHNWCISNIALEKVTQHYVCNGFLITDCKQSTYVIRFIHVKYLGCLLICKHFKITIHCIMYVSHTSLSDTLKPVFTPLLSHNSFHVVQRGYVQTKPKHCPSAVHKQCRLPHFMLAGCSRSGSATNLFMYVHYMYMHLLAHYVGVNIPVIEHIKCSCNLSAPSYLHSFKHTSSLWDIN